jgi:hypothetical protein
VFSAAAIDSSENVQLVIYRRKAPPGNFFKRTKTAMTQAACRVHLTDIDARRYYRYFFMLIQRILQFSIQFPCFISNPAT